MSASLTSGTYGLSGTYGRRSAFAVVVRRVMAKLFGGLGAARPKPSALARNPRARLREAHDVRELARSVVAHSPGFAADLYAAALRCEDLHD
ncbi:MAG: hypothetical protein ABW032_00295 [Burkholderiaceae bacterium]